MTQILGIDWSVWVSIGVLFFGICGYFFIIPYMAARKIKALIDGQFGNDMLASVMEKQVPVIIDGFKKFAASPEGKGMLQSIISENIPIIVSGVKQFADSEEGKLYISNTFAQVIPDVIGMHLKVNEDGKEKEIPLMNYIASVIVHNLKMQFLGEKGVLSREMKAAGDAVLKGANPQLAAVMEFINPIMQKHPVVGSLLKLGMQFIPQGNNGGSINGNAGNSAYTGG